MNPPQDNLPGPDAAGGSDSAPPKSAVPSELPLAVAPSALPDGRMASSESSKATNELAFQQDDSSMSLISEESSPLELVAWGLKHLLSQKKVKNHLTTISKNSKTRCTRLLAKDCKKELSSGGSIQIVKSRRFHLLLPRLIRNTKATNSLCLMDASCFSQKAIACSVTVKLLWVTGSKTPTTIGQMTGLNASTLRTHLRMLIIWLQEHFRRGRSYLGIYICQSSEVAVIQTIFIFD